MGLMSSPTRCACHPCKNPPHQVGGQSHRVWSGILQLNFDVYPGWQVQLHQGIDGFGRGLIDINDAAVGARFKMLPRVFVDVGRSQETIDPTLSGERNGSDRSGAGAVGSVYDLFARGVEETSIEGFESNANFLLLDSCHRFNC